VLKNVPARKVGETAPDGVGSPTLYPCPRGGGAPSKRAGRERQREPGTRRDQGVTTRMRSGIVLISISIRALRGVPAEGVGRDLRLGRRGKLSP
jgi:hypothetical protein